MVTFRVVSGEAGRASWTGLEATTDERREVEVGKDGFVGVG